MTSRAAPALRTQGPTDKRSKALSTTSAWLHRKAEKTARAHHAKNVQAAAAGAHPEEPA
jgi:hypothetical protein